MTSRYRAVADAGIKRRNEIQALYDLKHIFKRKLAVSKFENSSFCIKSGNTLQSLPPE
jgi:hypothetical protein